MRDRRERLLDIRQAIERIELHATRGRDAFDKDELIQIWIVHHLQIIGEAAPNFLDDLPAKASGIPSGSVEQVSILRVKCSSLR